MHCCDRPTPAPTPRWPTTRPAPAANAPPAEGAALRFIGPRALSLPLGSGRLLVQPGQVLPALAPADHRRLWRSGLFEAVPTPVVAAADAVPGPR
jgi:hypothetical protein